MSKGDISVNQLARDYFNGGGHVNAAGGAASTMEEAITTFKEQFLTILITKLKTMKETFILAIAVTFVACNQTSYKNVELNTQIDSVSYSLELVANNLKSSGFESIETQALLLLFLTFLGNE